ncbi:MAG: DUF4082 domain-containing protein [Cyclobacteriaceae bacterium]|nr:DUF4082 domain-containing protein [Cyclobacteriaceae bacterium]
MKNWIILTICSFAIISCSKDETVTPTIVESPLSTFLSSKTGLTFDTFKSDSYSLGYEFKTTADGSVTALGCSSTEAGTFALQLYQVDSVNNTGTLVASASIDLTASDIANRKFNYKTLAQKVAISKGVYYRVTYSVENKTFERLQASNNPSMTFPITSANKKVLIKRGVYGGVSSFPNQYWDVLYMADAKLEFK